MIELQTFLNEELRSDRLVYRVADISLIPKIVSYYMSNIDHFSTSISDYSNDYFDEEFHIERFWLEFDEMISNRAIHFYLFDSEDYLYEHIIGDVAINSIFATGPMSCILGYKINQKFTKNGYASEAIERMIDFIFEELELHRINLFIYEENIPSIQLAEKFKFELEGKLKEFMEINGDWSNFDQFSLINPEINTLNDNYELIIQTRNFNVLRFIGGVSGAW